MWLWTLRAAAVALALLSGWLLGRATPEWSRDDETLFSEPRDEWRDDGVEKGAWCGCFAGSWGAALAACAALVLLYYGWPGDRKLISTLSGSPRELLLLAVHCCLLGGAWVAGWVVGRLADKGPAGPLE